MGNELVQFYPATDIYALGATLYNMLTGVTPLSATLLASGEELEEMPDSISEKTKQAIESSMQLNRKKRPQSIAAFLEILGDTQTSNNHNYSHNSTFSYSSNSTANEETIVLDSSGKKNEINGHEYVDLGLPSGLKWATCNIGADVPEDYGDYFAWGETKPKKEYSENTYVFYHEKDESGLYDFGYGTKKVKYYDNLGIDISGTQYDAARSNWGGSWRMPTKKELEELKIKCKWIWEVRNGINGYKVIGPNSNSIFLPAAGTSQVCAGHTASYLSSTTNENDVNYEYELYFHKDIHDLYTTYRSQGKSIRPVTE